MCCPPRAGGVVKFRTCHPVGTIEWRLVEGHEPAPGTRFAKASTNIEGSRRPGWSHALWRQSLPGPGVRSGSSQLSNSKKDQAQVRSGKCKDCEPSDIAGGTLHKATREETVPNLPTSDLTTER